MKRPRAAPSSPTRRWSTIPRVDEAEANPRCVGGARAESGSSIPGRARPLHNEGLPPLHRLAEWLTIFSWVSRAQREGVSLCWMAFRMDRDPSACYRLVKQVTGLGWEELQARGEAWVLDQFLKELDRVGGLAESAKRSPSHTYPQHDLP